MIPIENSTAGRVRGHSYPAARQRTFILLASILRTIRHCLLATQDASEDTLEKRFTSHVQALGQCRKNLRAMGAFP